MHRRTVERFSISDSDCLKSHNRFYDASDVLNKPELSKSDNRIRYTVYHTQQQPICVRVYGRLQIRFVIVLFQLHG